MSSKRAGITAALPALAQRAEEPLDLLRRRIRRGRDLDLHAQRLARKRGPRFACRGRARHHGRGRAGRDDAPEDAADRAEATLERGRQAAHAEIRADEPLRRRIAAPFVGATLDHAIDAVDLDGRHERDGAAAEHVDPRRRAPALRSFALEALQAVGDGGIDELVGAFVGADILDVALDDEHPIARVEVREAQADPHDLRAAERGRDERLLVRAFGLEARGERVRHGAELGAHAADVEADDEVEIVREELGRVDAAAWLEGLSGTCRRELGAASRGERERKEAQGDERASGSGALQPAAVSRSKTTRAISSTSSATSRSLESTRIASSACRSGATGRSVSALSRRSTSASVSSKLTLAAARDELVEAPARAHLGRRGEEELHLGVREDDGADVAALEHDAAARRRPGAAGRAAPRARRGSPRRGSRRGSSRARGCAAETSSPSRQDAHAAAARRSGRRARRASIVGCACAPRR